MMRGLSVVCAAFTQKNSRGRFFGFDGSISFFLVVKKKEKKLDLDRFRTTLFIGCDVPLGPRSIRVPESGANDRL
jgi:hypothetical protein